MSEPRDILVAIASDGIAEIRLQLDLPMPVKAQPGTGIEFERAKIQGWPKR